MGFKMSENLKKKNAEYLPFDELKAKELIMQETGNGEKMASIIANSLHHIVKELQPVVEAWLSGKKVEYKYKGISMDDIIEKEHLSTVDAIFTMQTLIKSPILAEKYMSIDWRKK